VNATDPNLTGRLTAEYAALQNDLEQARLLAGDYQKQLCDKSNDLAALKLLLEKASRDLERFQAEVVALREERHRLANAAMRAVALEYKLNAMTEEMHRLRAAPREVIHLALEGSESVVVTPTTPEPRLFNRGPRRK